ncbi:hypothetical protein [Bacterioplanoides sp.]|uniref:hypothetical protein n=1 Tax=Bacterioplanoides sp. TaxID=2066072 RepID=UPI003B5CA405
MTSLKHFLLCCFCLMLSSQALAEVYSVLQETPDGVKNQPKWVTPEWTERHLYAIRSPLMKGSHTDHVVSLYYFGDSGTRTLIGLERIKGDDYLQYFSLLLFDKKTLIGYYPEVASFPSGVDSTGIVTFPKLYKPRLEDQKKAFSILAEEFAPLCLGKTAPCVNWVPAS